METIVALMASTIPFVVNIISDLIKELAEKKGKKDVENTTKDIAESLNRTKNEEKPTVSLDTVAEIETFFLITKNRVEYEINNLKTQQQCNSILKDARKMIDQAVKHNNVGSLTQAYEIIKHANSLITSSKAERWYVLGLLSVFLGSLIWLSIVTWKKWDEFEAIIILGIPFPALLWGAIGSGTAPLYRYLTNRKKSLEDPLKWFIVRPIIGMVMGAAIYLIVKSGLIVFGGTTQIVNPQLLWVLAFIGGFSETATTKAIQNIQKSGKENEITEEGN